MTRIVSGEQFSLARKVQDIAGHEEELVHLFLVIIAVTCVKK